MYTEYIVASNTVYAELVKRVVDDMKNGWQPLGGVAVAYGKFDDEGEPNEEGILQLLYSQAMGK